MEKKEDDNRRDKCGKKEEKGREDGTGKDLADGSKDEQSLADTTEKSDDYRDDDSIKNIFSEFIDDRGGCSKYLLDEPEEETIKVFGEEYKIKINGGNGNGYGPNIRKEGSGSKISDGISKKRDRKDKNDGFYEIFVETENKEGSKMGEELVKASVNTGAKETKGKKEDKPAKFSIPSKSAIVEISDRSRSREKKSGNTARSKSMGRNAGGVEKSKSSDRAFRSKSREGKIRSISRSKSRDRKNDQGEEKMEEPIVPEPGHEPEDIIVTFGKGESQGYFIAHAVDNARGFAKGAGKSDKKEHSKSSTKLMDKHKAKEEPVRRAKSIDRSPMRKSIDSSPMSRPPIKHTKKPKEISRLRKEPVTKPKGTAIVVKEEDALESETIPTDTGKVETPEVSGEFSV